MKALSKIFARLWTAVAVVTVLVHGSIILAFVVRERQEEKGIALRLLEKQYEASYPAASDVALLTVPNEVPAGDAPFRAIVEIVTFSKDSSRFPLEQERQLSIKAAAYAATECQALLKAIASRCRIIKTEVRQDSGLRLIMELELTQRPDIARVSSAKRSDLDALQIVYHDSRAGEARARVDAVYAKIAADCGEKSATLGNCAVQSVRLRGNFSQDKSVSVTEATVGIVVRARLRPGATPDGVQLERIDASQ